MGLVPVSQRPELMQTHRVYLICLTARKNSGYILDIDTKNSRKFVPKSINVNAFGICLCKKLVKMLQLMN
jgi:hypothetical protein